MIIIRLEHKKSKDGIFHNRFKCKEKTVIQDKLFKQLMDLGDDFTPTPTYEFKNYFGFTHYGCKYDEDGNSTYDISDKESKIVDKFISFYESKNTKYGCENLTTLVKKWLNSSKELVDTILQLDYNLVEYNVADENCFIMPNQVMFDCTKVINRRTLHTKDLLYKEI